MKILHMRRAQDKIFLLFIAIIAAFTFAGLIDTNKVGAWPLAANWGQPGTSPERSGRILGPNECGNQHPLQTGSMHDYAGIVIEMRLQNGQPARGGNLRAVVRNYNGQMASESRPGNIYNMSTGARYSSGAFNLRDNVCGRDSVAVLGYNGSSQRDGQGGTWVLDCDESIHGDGNGQDFEITGQGVPAGQPAGGTWQTKNIRSDNGYTVIVAVAYIPPDNTDWRLKKPVSQVNGGNGWQQTVYVKAGTTVKFRHQIGNNGPDRAENFDTWREYTYRGRSGGTKQSLNRGEDRYVGGETSYPIPGNAQEGDRFCERQAVSPERYGGSSNNILRAEYACAIVMKDPQGLPNFNLNADCRTGIHITDLRQASPNQDRNVATRVRVYPNNQGGGVVIDQNGNPQSDGDFVFRTRGNVNIPWPSGYGNVTWRVDVRAFALNHVNETQYSTLQANYIVPPCWDLTPSTDPVPGFVEQGGAVGFNHYVTNSSEKTAENINTCVITNYNINNPNGGNIGEYCSTGRQLSFGGIGRTGPLPNDSPVVYTGSDTPLGTTYCQYYRVSPANENSGETRSSTPACTKIVGGKTYLTVQPANEDMVEPGKTITVTGKTITNYYHDAPGYGGYNIGCGFNVVAYLPNGGSRTIENNVDCSHLVNGNGPSPDVVNYSYPATPADIGSNICVSVTIWAANGNDNLLASGYPRSNTSCSKVITKPYMKVIGGDISAASCNATNSIIAGWNKLSDEQDPTGGGDLGAGTRYAAFAQGAIQSFASGQGLPRETGWYGYSPTGLSFTNTENNDPGAGNFGGNFSGTPCVKPNEATYSKGKPADASSWPGMANAISAGGSKTYSINSPSSPTVLGGGTIPANVSIRLYVNGDVVLSDNIRSNYSGAMDASQMPNFTLVVNGNIYVQHNVQNMFGTYIAEGSRGNIYTCTNGSSPLNTINRWSNPPVAAGNPYALCGANQLMVTGAVVANKIHLLRTFGSLYQDDGGASGQAHAAEVFKYNPLAWIYSVTGPTTVTNDSYESVTTLPPVL
jgi:hypothetical protein